MKPMCRLPWFQFGRQTMYQRMAIYHNCKTGILIDVANLFEALQSLWILHSTI